MVELAEEINTAAPLYVANRVWRALNERQIAMNGARVLLLGITYKPNISDRRQSPADPMARRLASLGANVSFHDPFVPDWAIDGPAGPVHLKTVDDVYAAAAEADIVVLLQPHGTYDLGRLASASPLLLDTRGVTPDADTVQRL
jgi:UDP-N-acetyl-D-mannosaminuronate dehydrogenase